MECTRLVSLVQQSQRIACDLGFMVTLLPICWLHKERKGAKSERQQMHAGKGKSQCVYMCVARCFLLVTSSQGMQVVTYEGHQVSTMKFPGKAVETA